MIQSSNRSKRSGHMAWLLTVAVALLWTQSAHAHIEHGQAAGFASGFVHPWSGWDHIAAMVAVGIWGAQLGAPAIWLLPVVFPMVMAMGGFMGLIHLEFPGGSKTIEIGIALSALLLGAMVCGDIHSKKPGFLIFAAVLVGLFGLFHGHAHGTELPPGQSGLLYSIGFVIATGCLHGCGIALGVIHRWPIGRVALRGVGAIIALGGVYFLWEAISGGGEAPKTSVAAVYLSIGLSLL